MATLSPRRTVTANVGKGNFQVYKDSVDALRDSQIAEHEAMAAELRAGKTPSRIDPQGGSPSPAPAPAPAATAQHNSAVYWGCAVQESPHSTPTPESIRQELKRSILPANLRVLASQPIPTTGAGLQSFGGVPVAPKAATTGRLVRGREFAELLKMDVASFYRELNSKSSNLLPRPASFDGQTALFHERDVAATVQKMGR